VDGYWKALTFTGKHLLLLESTYFYWKALTFTGKHLLLLEPPAAFTAASYLNYEYCLGNVKGLCLSERPTDSIHMSYWSKSFLFPSFA
jgi:hypothetical protein